MYYGDIMVKSCNKCKNEFPTTIEYFSRRKRSKDGLNYQCKPCVQEDLSKWKKENPEKYKKGYLKANKRNYQKSVESVKKYANAWGSGVYGIFESEKCLYVGESNTLKHRIAIHKSGIKNPQIRPIQQSLYEALQNHNNIEFRILEQTNNHKEQEQVWIDYLNPLYNARD